MTGTPPPTAASKASGAAALGEPRQFEPMRGEHRLVRGDDGQAARQRRLDRLMSDPVRPADQFDEHVDFAASRQFARIGEERGLAQTQAAIPQRTRADAAIEMSRPVRAARSWPSRLSRRASADPTTPRPRRRRAKVSPWPVVLRSSRR